MPVGMFIGDSTLPLPDSIVAKIRKLEFVDLQELRPESCLLDEEADKKSVVARFKSKKKAYSNIFTWNVAVLVQSYPHSLIYVWHTWQPLFDAATDLKSLAGY